jgi:predicted Zn-dependent peptidase
VVHETRFGIPGSVNVEVVTGNERTLPAAERAIIRALDRVRAGVIPPDRLALAKKRLRTRWFRTAANSDALAFQIGHFQTMDRWQTLETFLTARDVTTLEEVQRVASKYLLVDNRTTGIVVGAGS